MSDVWLPGFERIQVLGAEGGSIASGPTCGVAHTTEGSWESALSVFRSKRVASHLLADPATRRRAQFIPLDRSAYALVNASGGVETNRRGHVVQLEIVGFAGRMHDLPDDQLKWLATEVFRPASEAVGITGPGLTCYGEGAGWVLATPSARQRLSMTAWQEFDGWCGHQHVPENSHWDPGALDLPRIVQIAYQGADDVTREELDDALVEADERAKAREKAMVDAIVAEIRADRRMTLDLVEAVSTEAGVDPTKVRARLKPETRAALDKVAG